MGASILHLSYKFIWTVVGIFLIGSLPSLFHLASVDFTAYFQQLGSVVADLLHPTDIIYFNPDSGLARDLFPEIFEPVLYSLKIYFGAFFLALIVALATTCLVVFLRKRQIRWIEFLANIVESLPDVFIVFSFQLFIVWFYQQTGTLIMNIAGLGQDYAYLGPILCLSILPTMLFFRVMLLIFNEELEQPYVELAKSKGLTKKAIVFVHVLRNSLIGIFHHSQSILWLMLSNLLVLEYIFNIYGITRFIMTFFSPDVLTVGMLLIFVPIYLILALGRLLIERLTDRQVEAS
ncbi:MAG TPA: ABC transporter permease subunit [Bacillales bacterium]|nr:ABC transporter permease subunit [Bacillales bacterium]